MFKPLHTQPEAPEASTAPRRPLGRRWLFLVALAIVLFVVGVYRAPWNPVFRWAARGVPFPAARVDGSWVRLGAAMDSAAAMARASGTQPSEQLSAAVSWQMRLTAMRVLAKRWSVEVGVDEVEASVRGLEQAAGGPEAFARELQDAYGWTLEQFGTRLVRPFVLAQKLEVEVQKRSEIQQSAYEKILSAQKQIEAGEPFAVVAAHVSEDAYGGVGGERGEVLLAELPASWRFALEVAEFETLLGPFEQEDQWNLLVLLGQETSDAGTSVRLQQFTIYKLELNDVVDQFLREEKVLRFGF